MECVEIQLASVLAAPAEARTFMRSTLQIWQLDGFGEVTELLTSELVTNVVRHVGERMTVRARFEAPRLRVEVDDPIQQQPTLRHATPLDRHGRGIRIIDQLADAWGTTVHDAGKTVWFEIDVDTATP